MTQRFKVGDGVFVASFERRQIQVTCPDCFGKKKLRVILGDDTEVQIDCVGCSPGGYEGPLGFIKNYEWLASAEYRVIHSVEERVSSEKTQITYYFSPVSGIRFLDSDNRTFVTKEEAVAKANELKLEYEQEENRRLMAKTKDHRTWAWNAHYHRKEVKRAREQVIYHEKKLGIANEHVKKTA